MSNKLITMHQIRTIIQYLQRGVSYRAISRELKLSRNTIKLYVDRLEKSSLSLSDLQALTDSDLSLIVYPSVSSPATTDPRKNTFADQIDYFLSELTKTGVTRSLLWQEYRKENPEGYSYSQFCELLSQHEKIKGASMYFHYQPAEVMMVDFAGSKLSYVDKETGELVACPVFVCVLPYSGFSYAVALSNAATAQVVRALNEALYFFEGVPLSVKCDNMKVFKSCRYQPIFSEVIQQWALHNNIGLLTARVGKPKDKALVENEVKLAYQRIYAPLRDQRFYNLSDLNKAIKEHLNAHHARPFQKKEYTRSACFALKEKPLLQPLPAAPFIIKHAVQAKVQKNYHITLGEDWHHYSVPFNYIGKIVQAVYDTDFVEVYLDHKRIALHKRAYNKHGYSTVKEHMPEGHQRYFEQRGWNADYFLTQAQKIGASSFNYIQKVLEGKRFTEQTYNACLGLLRLARSYGNDRFELACKRGLSGSAYSYRVIHNILENNLDKEPGTQQMDLFHIPLHDNLRGPEQYQ